MSTQDEGQQDVFDDQPAASTKSEAEITADKPEAEAKDAPAEEEDQPGEEKASGTPPEGQEESEDTEAATNGKMIPEHRFKAALKDVTDKFTTELNDAKQKIAQYEATPAPDKEKDPEGYDLHVRMEASKSVMREMRPDYQEVITHYKKMADENPDLNVAVSKSPLPAKFAYDLAKKDLELKELAALKDSPDFKEFQEWKKSKVSKEEQEEESEVKATQKVMPKVPNLNKATSVSRANSKPQTDDELFEGKL